MYAVIISGGRQYRVAVGETIRVEKLEKTLGTEFEIEDVLMVGGEKIYIGQPLVKNARVSVVVTQQAKDKKILVFKKKRRKNYRRMKGHRQLFTELFVKAITNPDGVTAKASEKPVVIQTRVVDVPKIMAEAKEKRVARRLALKTDGAPAVKKAAPKKKVAVKKSTKGTVKRKSAAKKTAKKATK